MCTLALVAEITVQRNLQYYAHHAKYVLEQKEKAKNILEQWPQNS
jgi:hypothetical protein